MNNKIAYVILHYNEFETTKDCIESLLAIVSESSEIVVVDNNSSNNSGSLLKEFFSNLARIHFLFVKQNIGFARGNNIGYVFAKEQLLCDVICVLNNDVLVKQTDFEKKLLALVKDSPVDVIGPKILNGSGSSQNPFRYQRVSSAVLLKILIVNILFLLLLDLHIFKKTMSRLLREDSNKFREADDRTLENVVLHGSFLIFCNKYVRDVPFAFPPITFFYGEEDVLFDYVLRHGFKTLYCPILEIRHIEKVSTKKLDSDIYKRGRIITKRRIGSAMARLRFRIKRAKC